MISFKMRYLFAVVCLTGILFLGFTLAGTPIFFGENINYSTNEDQAYYHLLSDNLTSFGSDIIFDIDASGINWTNASGTSNVAESVVSDWISILNSSNGNLSINASYDNQSGFFVIPIQATNTTDSYFSGVSFKFIVNATNDNPMFTDIEAEYNLTQGQSFLDYISASDEEEMYGMFFNISFYSNCSLGAWSTRTNCSIFEISNVSDTSAILNFTPTRNDVGTYWANISVRDWGEQSSCPHVYCDNATYKQNKTTYEHSVVFNVFSILSVNASDCQDKIFQENQAGACQINITSEGETDTLDINSDGSIRNYAASVANASWFYGNNVTNASNFASEVFVNVIPQKTEVGNWTINFSVYDTTTGESVSELIYVYVNRTLQDTVDLIDIANLNTSVDLETTINLTVYDDDLLVPDKLEGYNETISFNVTIFNQSNLSQGLSLNGFDVEILSMPVAGTNRTEARIQFTANDSEVGNYSINITINDEENSIDSDLFNLAIISNNYPIWNQTMYLFNMIVNSSFGNTTNFGPINLSDGYVTDTADDTITFTNDSSAMPRFNLSAAGWITFTPYKQDVGSWNFSVTATDSLGLQNVTTFSFNITNINSDPDMIEPFTPTANVSIDINSNMNVTEDNYTVFRLFIQDEDFRIAASQKGYYNESLSINLIIEGNNSNLFSIVRIAGFPTAGNNQSLYGATFTPNRTDMGDYNITINVTDASGASDFLTFNLTVNGMNDAPVLDDLVNHTTAINRSFYYDMNASDEEDGNDTAGNLWFSYNFESGTDIFNTTTFNSTYGKINITFNSSQGGAYKINITVNDSGNLKDSQIFWIYVYDLPNATYPSIGDNFSLQENVTSNLTFRGNHSVLDNLTYEFYLNNSLKYNVTYFGNDTNLTWAFTPDFTDETYGENVNLTLVMYSANSDLTNRVDLNYTVDWNVNVSHTNSPVIFSGYIGDKQTSYDQTIEINLSTYFSDPDYNDANYNESVNFTVASDSSPSYISTSVSSDWILSLSSLIAITEVLNITANDPTSSAVSNNFGVEFTVPSVVTTPVTVTSTVTVPVSLKLIMPGPVSAYEKDQIVLPLTLYNDGRRTLSGINLASLIAKDNVIRDDVTISFDKSHVDSLGPGEKEEVVMTIDVDTQGNGTFEITVNATVDSPKYTDWGKFYLTIEESENLVDRLLFTQEFLQENPECIELEELLDEARAYFEEGDFINTVLKIQESIDGCKNAISQQARAKKQEKTENLLYRYLLIATICVLFIGFGYYSYKRIMLKRSSGAYFFKQEKNKDLFKKTSLATIIIGIMVVLFMSIRGNITGFVIRGVSSENQLKFGLAFVFITGVFGLLILLKGNRMRQVVKKTKENKKALLGVFKRRGKDFNKNEMRGLIKKEVYTDGGDYIGKIEEVVLDGSRIGDLKIKLYGEKGFWTKGIVIDYNHVKDVGNIVIIKKKILDKILEKDDRSII